jgi:ArsR family transcriptional regulator, arsenate/arsenite/antimonite-responsive transcriptional repressor / arsenate reductase (thioredoxin)
VEVAAQQPPALFRLAGDPVRWGLVRALAQSDRRVRELTAAPALPQSLVSYHLGRLRAAGRDTYYRLDLDRCRDLLADAGAALHPAAVRVMGARGIDISGHVPKHLDTVLGVVASTT